MEPLLKACCVSYSYHSPEGATPALFQVSFTVDPGEFLAIVGPAAASPPCFPCSPDFWSRKKALFI